MSSNVEHPERWVMLGIFWLAHALVAGSARAMFEASMPYFIKSPSFQFTAEDVAPLLAMGTLVTVVGKFVGGPLTTIIGPYHIAWGSLFASGLTVLAVGQFDRPSGPLLSIFVGWSMIRFFASGTWPATNTILISWFPSTEHGRAWGIMSTGSRMGILMVSGALALTKSEDIAFKFNVAATLILAYGVIVLFFLQATPSNLKAVKEKDLPTTSETRLETGSDKPKTPAKDNALDGSTPGPTSSVLSEIIASTICQPTFYLAFLVHFTVIPISEFQSQLSLMLSKDSSLDSSIVNIGTGAWHLGCIIVVLIAGVLFDRCTDIQRGLLLGLPITLSSGLFFFLRTYGIAAIPNTSLKILLCFVMGGAYAPAAYLSMTTWCMRHATKRVMPIASCLIDLGGYVGSLYILHLQRTTIIGDPMLTLMGYLSLSGAVCACAIGALFLTESWTEKAKRA